MTTAVVVGSGPNGLAAALTLAAEEIDALVLEAADTRPNGPAARLRRPRSGSVA